MPEKAIKLSNDDMQRILVIYESYHVIIKQVAMLVLRDAALAEDCLHEVMIRLMSVIDSVEELQKMQDAHVQEGGKDVVSLNEKGGDKRLGAFIDTVTRNLAIDMLRKARRESCPGEASLSLALQDTYTQVSTDRYFLDENGFSIDLWECISQLTAGEQSVIYLKYACDFPFEKVAGILCIEKSCAEQRASRARKKLRKMLEEMDYER